MCSYGQEGSPVEVSNRVDLGKPLTKEPLFLHDSLIMFSRKSFFTNPSPNISAPQKRTDIFNIWF